MFQIDSFKNSILKAVSVFDRLEIPFHLTGGITSIAYGEPRLTQDIDIVIQNNAALARCDLLLKELTGAGFRLDSQASQEAISSKKVFQVLDTSESLKLDIYPRELIPDELKRSELVEVFEGTFLPIASRVDVAISKLIWVHKGSHKSRRDFRKVFENCSEIEQSSIRSTASSLELDQLLVELQNEKDEIIE